MLMAALRDLQWRRRRFLIAVVGTGLVFAMSLLMNGLSTAFRREISHTLTSQGADYWVAPAGSPGPFSAGFGVRPDMVERLRKVPGITQVSPVTFVVGTARIGDRLERVAIMGVDEHGFGFPATASSGSSTPTGRKIVVARRLKAGVGTAVELNGHQYEVGGVLSSASLFAGSQLIYMTNSEAQQSYIFGAQQFTFVLVKGDVSNLPGDFVAFTRHEANADLLRPVKNAVQSVDLIKMMLWLVAALIVGSVVYMTALERTRDIAVFKATGVGTPAIAVGICLQAVLMALAAAVVGGAVALLLQPVFPMEVVVPTTALWTMPVLAVAVGILAGLFGIRRTVKVDPSSAFGGP